MTYVKHIYHHACPPSGILRRWASTTCCTPAIPSTFFNSLLLYDYIPINYIIIIGLRCTTAVQRPPLSLWSRFLAAPGQSFEKEYKSSCHSRRELPSLRFKLWCFHSVVILDHNSCGRFDQPNPTSTWPPF